MDVKLLASTFIAIFLAELGDKTQLATLTLTAGGGAGTRWTVFSGAALALVASSALAVMGGELVSKLVSPAWLQRIAGGVFIVLGVLYIWRATKD